MPFFSLALVFLICSTVRAERQVTLLTADKAQKLIMQDELAFASSPTLKDKASDTYSKQGNIYLQTGKIRQAIEFYRQVLEANQKNNQEIYKLHLDFLDVSTLELADKILQAFTHENQDSITPLEKLFLARSLFVLERDSLACSYYFKCLESLDAITAWELLRDITDIIFKKEKEEYTKAKDIKGKQIFFRKFWRARDPLSQGGFNKRLAEHYKRLNYAKSFFFAKRMNGYDDRGRIYIKHGEPDQKIRPSSSAMVYENESWLYRKKPDDFIFHFVRKFVWFQLVNTLSDAVHPTGNDAEKIAFLITLHEERVELDNKYFNIVADLRDGNQPAMYRLSQFYISEMDINIPALTKGENSETFNPFPGIKPLDYYYFTADFMSPDTNSTLYIYYGLPLKQLERHMEQPSSNVNYECTLFLFNKDWHQAAKTTDRRSVKLVQSSAQLNKGSFIFDWQVVFLPPGQYFYLVSVKDLNSGRLGVYTDTLELTAYKHGYFNVSQLVPANALKKKKNGKNGGKFARGQLNIMALPSRTFSREQQAFIYFEIYYLKKNSEGKKRYAIDFSINAVRLDKNLFSKIYTPLARLHRKNKKESSITLRFDKEQEDPDRIVQQEYISIDISDSPLGKYDLQVTVTDLASGQKVTRSSFLFITGDE